jgi:hypothetical protein
MAKKEKKEKKAKKPKTSKKVQGMQMPGAGAHSGPSMNVYTGLSFLAVIALGAALAIVFINSQKLLPSNSTSPLTLQQTGNISLD